jgi:hypothetical protein
LTGTYGVPGAAAATREFAQTADGAALFSASTSGSVAEVQEALAAESQAPVAAKAPSRPQYTQQLLQAKQRALQKRGRRTGLSQDTPDDSPTDKESS